MLVAAVVLRCSIGVGDYPWEPFGRHPTAGLLCRACDMYCFEDMVAQYTSGMECDTVNEFAS
jgi:hypothetical protein